MTEEQNDTGVAPTSTLMVDHELNHDVENQMYTWNDKIEETAKDIGEMSKSSKLMHIDVARKSEKKYKWFMYGGIALGPCAGIVSAIGEAVTIDPDPVGTTFTIIAVILGFLSGIIVAIIKFGKFDEVSSSNKLAASRYTSLESNVRRQLTLYRNDRPPGKQYLEWLNKAYDELFLASPLVPEYIFLRHAKRAEKEGRSAPNEYGKTISINKDYEQVKIDEILNITDIVVNAHEDDVGSSQRSHSPNEEDDGVEQGTEQPPLPTHSSDPAIKGAMKIKRSNTFAQFPELGKFSDKQMDYEMRRFMGF